MRLHVCMQKYVLLVCVPLYQNKLESPTCLVALYVSTQNVFFQLSEVKGQTFFISILKHRPPYMFCGLVCFHADRVLPAVGRASHRQGHQLAQEKHPEGLLQEGPRGVLNSDLRILGPIREGPKWNMGVTWV